MNNRIDNARLYGILDTGYCHPDDFPQMAQRLIQGGVGILQVRAKGAHPDEIIRWSQPVSKITRAREIPLIINDHPECVEPAGASGCHIGQEDMDVASARRLMPEGSLCGKSTHSLAQVKETIQERPDYIGFGPIFSTPTKPDYGEIGYRDIASMENITTVPAFCIGGIKLENVERLVKAGARRVVIVSGLLLSKDPENYAQKVRKALDGIHL